MYGMVVWSIKENKWTKVNTCNVIVRLNWPKLRRTLRLFNPAKQNFSWYSQLILSFNCGFGFFIASLLKIIKDFKHSNDKKKPQHNWEVTWQVVQ